MFKNLLISDIASVVVLYQPSKDNLDQLMKTSKVFNQVIVINNSPNNELIKSFFTTNNNNNLIVHNNPDNLGIAQALNNGIEIAKKMGYNWVVTLDQDSNFELSILENMVNCYNNIQMEDIISLSPMIINHNIIPNQLKERQKNPYNFIVSTITSGNLLKISAWKAVNGFKEELFIDVVDTEFSHNLFKHHFKLIEVTNALMVHAIGELGEIKIFNHSIYWDKHSKIRNYYIVRNNIYFVKNWLFIHPFLTLYYIKESLIKLQLKVLLFESDKWKNLKVLFEGIKDGIFNNLGKKDLNI
jgi:rhamnosyltransferase